MSKRRAAVPLTLDFEHMDPITFCDVLEEAARQLYKAGDRRSARLLRVAGERYVDACTYIDHIRERAAHMHDGSERVH